MMGTSVIEESQRAVDWVGPNYAPFISAVEARGIPVDAVGRVGRYQCGDKILYGCSLVRR